MRRHLVEQLRSKGITDEGVLSVIGSVPRHLFMDSGFESHAYQDKAFPISAEQTISQPYTVAFQSQLLQVQQGQNVLEIGTGSGYQTAVLTMLGANVYSIERQHQLYRYSMRQLPKLGYHPKNWSLEMDIKVFPNLPLLIEYWSLQVLLKFPKLYSISLL